MIPVPGAANIEVEAVTMTIDRHEVEPSDGRTTAARPGDELVPVLASLADRGVGVVVQTPLHLDGGITVDLVVSGPRGSFGIICDGIDASRIRRNPTAMDGPGLNRIYCVSAVECMVDPSRVVHSIARFEPGYFRTARPATASRATHVECVRPEDPVSRVPRRQKSRIAVRSSRAA